MLPKGKYWTGDLCYVMHDEWDEVCSLILHGNSVLNGEFQLKDGRKFAIQSTMYGDGTYYDQHGNRYLVDAGCIGCIRVEDIKDTSENHLYGGHVHEFKHDFTIKDFNGDIHIADIIIPTGDTEEDDYYGDDDYYDEDDE